MKTHVYWVEGFNPVQQRWVTIGTVGFDEGHATVMFEAHKVLHKLPLRFRSAKLTEITELDRLAPKPIRD